MGPRDNVLALRADRKAKRKEKLLKKQELKLKKKPGLAAKLAKIAERQAAKAAKKQEERKLRKAARQEVIKQATAAIEAGQVLVSQSADGTAVPEGAVVVPLTGKQLRKLKKKLRKAKEQQGAAPGDAKKKPAKKPKKKGGAGAGATPASEDGNDDSDSSSSSSDSSSSDDEEDDDVPAAKKPAAAAAQRPAPAPPSSKGSKEQQHEGGEEGAKRSRSTIPLVSKDVATYLNEVVEHLKGLVDDEERQLLVGNVLEEIAGKEQAAAGDPHCSRHMDALLAVASPKQLMGFLAAVMETGGLSHLATSPFGSHVAEKVLIRLGDAHDALPQDEYEQLSQLLKSITQELVESLWSFVTDKFATHVARRVLCVLCGADILPAGARGPSDPSASSASALLAGGAEAAAALQPDDALLNPNEGSRKGGYHAPGMAVSGLAARTAQGGGAAGGKGKKGAKGAAAAAAAASGACRFPEQVEAVVRVLCREDYGGESMTELVGGRYSSPFLQAALRAAALLPNSRSVLCALVPAVLGAGFFIEGAAKQGKVLEGVKPDHVAAMQEDPTASHVLEVAIAASGNVPGLLEELSQRFFLAGGEGEGAEAGRKLRVAALHPHANFVVQALLAACTTPAQVTPLFEQLSPVLAELLRRRRGGVVAALVAACGRAGACQRELCAALSGALTANAPWAGKPATEVLAAALLSLDGGGGAPLQVGSKAVAMPDAAALCQVKAGGPPGGQQQQAPRLSQLGASILIAVLKFQQGACRDFTDSLLNLPPATLALVGRDPAGSWALESLLDGTAPAKIKAKLLQSLTGGWAVVASSPSGSFLVEKAYTLADVAGKEKVVSELLAHERALQGTRWGPKLLARVGADAYKRDSAQWRRSAESTARTLQVFSDLFGAEENGGGGAGGKQGKKKGEQEGTAAAAQAQAQQQAQDAGGDKKKKGKKKRQLEQQEEEEEAAEPEPEAPAAANGVHAEGEEPAGKKHKKGKKQAAEAAEAAEQEGKKKGKKQAKA